MAKIVPEVTASDFAVQAWKTHESINQLLISAIPPKGLLTRPDKSKGRNVGEQLVHMARVRSGWVVFQKTGARAKLPRAKDSNPTRSQLKKLFRESASEVAEVLADALNGRMSIRFFGKNPLRWMSYLISHESHHRGQILIALRQGGFPLPEELRLNGFWKTWIFARK